MREGREIVPSKWPEDLSYIHTMLSGGSLDYVSIINKDLEDITQV